MCTTHAEYLKARLVGDLKTCALIAKAEGAFGRYRGLSTMERFDIGTALENAVEEIENLRRDLVIAAEEIDRLRNRLLAISEIAEEEEE